MQRLSILTAALSCIAIHVTAQVNVKPAIWMPKQYLDARQEHPAKDDYWKTVDFSKYLSPVASLRVRDQQTTMQTYGTDNFPISVKHTINTPGRTEWVLDKPVFNGGQAAQFEKISFSLISHNNDKQDLWLGMQYPDGRKDSIQFEQAPLASWDSPIWMHANNYLTYLFKGKRFDIYDHQSHLLYSNVQTTKEGKITGLPGFSEWNVFTGNTLQLTEDGEGTIGFANYTITFAGENLSLQPMQARGLMNQKLVLKEKQ